MGQHWVCQGNALWPPNHVCYWKSELLLPHCGNLGEYVSAISLLYAVRKPKQDDLRDPYLKFPSRYSHMCRKDELDLTVLEVMKCFSREGALPKVFAYIDVYNDIAVDYASIPPCYLSKIMYDSIIYLPLTTW